MLSQARARRIEHWKFVELVPNPTNHGCHSDAQIAGYRWQYHGLWFRLPADRFRLQPHTPPNLT